MKTRVKIGLVALVVGAASGCTNTQRITVRKEGEPVREITVRHNAFSGQHDYNIRTLDDGNPGR